MEACQIQIHLQIGKCVNVAGASHFVGLTFTDDTSVTPLIGPSAGLDDVISMMNNGNDSIHLRLPITTLTLQCHRLAAARGVDITVVIHEPESGGRLQCWPEPRNPWELEMGIEVMQFHLLLHLLTSTCTQRLQNIHLKFGSVQKLEVIISAK